MFFKAVKKIFGILAAICYVIIVVVICILTPILAGWTPMYVKSPSMEPAIKTGSLIYHHKVQSISELQAGDVIAFKTQGSENVITHRLTEVNEQEGTLQTKGDGNDSEDPDILVISNVVGKVGTFVIPNIGYVIVYLKKPIFFLLAAVIILGNLALGKAED